MNICCFFLVLNDRKSKYFTFSWHFIDQIIIPLIQEISGRSIMKIMSSCSYPKRVFAFKSWVLTRYPTSHHLNYLDIRPKKTSLSIFASWLGNLLLKTCDSCGKYMCCMYLMYPVSEKEVISTLYSKLWPFIILCSILCALYWFLKMCVITLSEVKANKGPGHGFSVFNLESTLTSLKKCCSLSASSQPVRNQSSHADQIQNGFYI